MREVYQSEEESECPHGQFRGPRNGGGPFYTCPDCVPRPTIDRMLSMRFRRRFRS